MYACRGFSELKRTFTVPKEINYVRSEQVNFPCGTTFLIFSHDFLDKVIVMICMAVSAKELDY